MTTQLTKIYEEQLKESYIQQIEKNAANGVASLDSSTRISINVLPANITEAINNASITQKGVVQLSNDYTGTSQTLATTEKALSDGLYQVRTYITTTILFIVGTGTDSDTVKYITAGTTNLDCSSVWPSTTLYGITLFRNGLYKLGSTDWTYSSANKIVYLTESAAANDNIVVVFDAVMNGEAIAGIGYSKAEMDYLLSLKSDINSPAFTGIPTAPTVANSVNSDQIATTAYVQNAFTEYIGGRKIVVSTTTPTGTFSDGDIWIQPEA